MAEKMITRQDAEALIEVEVAKEILEGVVKESKALQMFKRLPNMSTNKSKMRVLDSLPVAYWQGSETAKKQLTKMAWANKFIVAEELAVIVPIPEAVLDDADVDIWEEVKPRIVEAFGRKIDAAMFVGEDKPAGFREGLLPTVISLGKTTSQGEKSLYETINDAMVLVEESGYDVNGVLGGVGLKGKFRMMLDNNGQPIKGTEIDSLPKAYVDNGSWDKSKAEMIVGDFSNAVYSIRQDVTYKVLTEAVIQDPSDGSILYNLAQQDMVALRCVMRLGWEVPNPVNATDESETRFPFSAIVPDAAATSI